jgi:hypothetical protein
MGAAENPFRYGDIVTGAAFADRTDEVSQLRTDVAGGQNVVVIAPRRTGKSSLMRVCVDALRAEGALVAECDLFAAPDKGRLVEQLTTALYRGLLTPFERVGRRSLDFLRRMPVAPIATVDPEDGSLSFTLPQTLRRGDIDVTLERLLHLPGEVAAERGRRVALVLDEFQEVTRIDRDLPRLMRAVFQLQPDVAHVYLGSHRHMLRRLFTERNEPLFRSAKVMELGPIPAPLFAPFIGERFAATGRSITPDAVARVLEITAGQPYDTQELCRFVWALAGEGTATADLVEPAFEQAVLAESARCATIWEALSPYQRLVLLAVAHESGRIYSEEYRHRHRLGPPARVQKAVAALSERDLVAGGARPGYTVPDPFLRAWLAGRVRTSPVSFA